MRFDKLITLYGGPTYAKDEIGQEVETTTGREVYANEFTVSASEFYAAGQQGLRPERDIQIRAEDYGDEKAATVDGADYAVIRAIRRGQWVNLILERKGAGANGGTVS